MNRIGRLLSKRLFFSAVASTSRTSLTPALTALSWYSGASNSLARSNANQNTHDRVVNDLDDLNEIPFISNAKSVYLYSVYGAGKFKNLEAQDWTGVNIWDSSYSPKGIASDFHGILDSPAPPFPPAERGEKESEDQEYNSEEELQQKFDAVSGLLGL